MKLFKPSTQTPPKTREQRQKEFLLVWSKNKGTYLTISGILFLMSLLLIPYSIFELHLVDTGNIRWATIINIKEDDGGFRQLGSTDITVQYRDDGAYIEEDIHLPLSAYGFFIGERIRIAQDLEIGTIVIHSKAPYVFNLVIGIIVFTMSLLPLYYHFSVFKKHVRIAEKEKKQFTNHTSSTQWKTKNGDF